MDPFQKGDVPNSTQQQTSAQVTPLSYSYGVDAVGHAFGEHGVEAGSGQYRPSLFSRNVPNAVNNKEATLFDNQAQNLQVNASFASTQASACNYAQTTYKTNSLETQISEIKSTKEVIVTAPVPLQHMAEKKKEPKGKQGRYMNNLLNTVNSSQNRFKSLSECNSSSFSGPSHLTASVVPSAFPRELTFRALAIYSTIRTLSSTLRLSPFTPNAFLRALSLPIHSKLLGETHASIIRLLFAYYNLGVYHTRGDGISKSKVRQKSQYDGVAEYASRRNTMHPHAGENLVYLDHYTWPLYFLDYARNVEVDVDEDLYSPLLEGNELDRCFKSKGDTFSTVSSIQNDIDNLYTQLPTHPPELNTWHHFANYQNLYHSMPPSNMMNEHNGRFSTYNNHRNGSIPNSLHQYNPGVHIEVGDPRQRLESDPIAPQVQSKKRSYSHISNLVDNTATSSEQTKKMKSIKEAIEQYIIGPSRESISPKDSDSRAETKKKDRTNVRAFDEALKEKLVKDIKDGVSYHYLAIESKLQILEYLVDELIKTNLVKLQLDARDIQSYYQRSLYGNLPDSHQMKNLVNEDECYVCGMDGDLICCDGCVASYHRECINIPLSRIESPDHWYCHECNILDSSKFGSLQGGQKRSLDWFTIDDLELNNKEEATYHCQSPSMCVDLHIERCSILLKSVEFLIVHGYVFARDKQTKNKVAIESILTNISPDIQSNESPKHDNSPTPLTPKELFSLLSCLGPSICTQWPWAQIPFNPEIFHFEWAKCQNMVTDENSRLMALSKQRYNLYICKADSFNPNQYCNAYQKAPLHGHILKAIGKKKIKLNTNVLSVDNVIVGNNDLSRDVAFVQLLRNGHYDQFKPIRAYMTCLEIQLSRSMLLHEFWGLRNKSRDLNWWSNCIKKSKCVETLGKLLVRLIDDTNPRAFVQEWNLLPGNVSDDHSNHSDEVRHYSNLGLEWTENEAKLRRKWERCSKNDILSLLENKSASRVDRKGKKKMINSSTVETKELKVQITCEENLINDSKSRRKTDRYNSINITSCSANELQRYRIRQLEKETVVDEMQVHWPMAGRKLFEPQGSIPQPTVKWLGRNGGTKRIPLVTYTNKFEIGLPSVCHIWRQKTLKAISYEQLIYQISMLESYLNRNAMQSLESITRRTTYLKGIQKVVRCSQVDLKTGELEHFVINRGKNRGCWLQHDAVEISTFVSHQFARRKVQRDKRLKEENERRMKEKGIVAQNEQKIARETSQKRFDLVMSDISQRHGHKIMALMKQCKRQGLSTVPTNLIQPWRDKHFQEMCKTAKRENGWKKHDNVYLSTKLCEAEVNGRDIYVEELRRELNKPRGQAAVNSTKAIIQPSCDNKQPKTVPSHSAPLLSTSTSNNKLFTHANTSLQKPITSANIIPSETTTASSKYCDDTKTTSMHALPLNSRKMTSTEAATSTLLGSSVDPDICVASSLHRSNAPKTQPEEVGHQEQQLKCSTAIRFTSSNQDSASTAVNSYVNVAPSQTGVSPCMNLGPTQPVVTQYMDQTPPRPIVNSYSNPTPTQQEVSLHINPAPNQAAAIPHTNQIPSQPIANSNLNLASTQPVVNNHVPSFATSVPPQQQTYSQQGTYTLAQSPPYQYACIPPRPVHQSYRANDYLPSQQVSQQVPSQVYQQGHPNVSQQVSNQVSNQVSPQLSQQISQLVSQQVSQQISQMVAQQVPRQVYQHGHQKVHPQVHQQVPQQVPHQVHQSLHQHVPRQVHQSLHQQVPRQVHQSLHQQVPRQVHQSLHQQVPQQAHQSVHQQVPQQPHESLHQQVPQQLHQQVPQQVFQQIQQQVYQQMRQQIPQQVPQQIDQQIKQQMP